VRRSGGRAVGRTAATVLTTAAVLLTALPPGRLAAQVVDTVPKRVPAVVHYGKWVTLAGVIALGAGAKVNNDRAEESYDALQAYCFESPVSCVVGPGGGYIDPVAEDLYDQTTVYDRRAGRYLIAAEVAFAATVVGFVWELIERKENPRTIPFEPRIEPGVSQSRVGLVIRF
jgi:hypothetical protein